MNLLLLNSESQEFINEHLNSDVTELILKGNPIAGLEIKNLVEQIESKRRCQKKLPTWFKQENIYYPNKLNIEQTSSEITAKYKASLIKGNSIIDLTGGFGVDCWAFSKHFKSITHCEINLELSQIAAHNFKQLNIQSIETIASNGLSYLQNSGITFDWIYVDPSRRHDSKGKVFFLKYCLPNVPKELDTLFAHSNNIMIKTSPLLDISVGMSELKHVKSIHVVAVNNEVKEVLWILENNFDANPILNTVNIKAKDNEYFEFSSADESTSEANHSLPLKYLFEPNAALLKAGAFNSIATKLKLFKLHKHSHLYTSETIIDFPGRCFRIESFFPYNKKQIKEANIKKANITTRNFPESVQTIRNRWKIKDGGNIYLLFTTNMLQEKIVLVCTKVD
ncbi:MAG: class I SAM-dependent methyltransferase [Aquaticitalea sp.]